jgi:hypothetical protein
MNICHYAEALASTSRNSGGKSTVLQILKD